MDAKLKEWFGDRLSADESRLTIRLDPPIETGVPDKPMLHELVLHEPTIGQVEEAQREGGGPIQVSVRLMELITGLSPRIIRKVPVSEYARASAFLENFIVAGRPTGELA